MPHTRSGIPWAKQSDTSYEAALRAAPFVAEQGLRVYHWVRSRGPRGATQKEAEAALGIARASLCARFKALQDASAVRQTSHRRGGCAVYVVMGPIPQQLQLMET